MNKEKQIKVELSKTIGNNHYNGWNNRTTFGYHSYNIDDIHIVGQRTPAKRLEQIKKHIDFEGKKVVDFGCNVGAMLHHLPEIEIGLGFDYDFNCISAARKISEILERDNLNFHVHDFDKMAYQLLEQRISFEPDVIFVLSLGSWVKSWQQLYSICNDKSKQIVLELNNDTEGKPQLDYFTSIGRTPKLIIENSNDDTTGNNLRKTYLL